MTGKPLKPPYKLNITSLSSSRSLSSCAPWQRRPRLQKSQKTPDHTGNKSTPEEAYLRGKRDPKNPSESEKRYNCGKTGHISRHCPDSKKELAKEKGQLMEKTSTAAVEAAAVEGLKGTADATATNKDWGFDGYPQPLYKGGRPHSE